MGEKMNYMSEAVKEAYEGINAKHGGGVNPL